METLPSTQISYRTLAPAEIIRTAEVLLARIRKRFPGSGLAEVCGELVRVCREVEATSNWLARPNYTLRAIEGLCIALLVGMLVLVGMNIRVRFDFDGLSDLLQGLESGVNDVVFIGLAIWFLSRLEARWKRSRALKSLHILRSLAHIVDMHQLTKDPEEVTGVVGIDPDFPSERLMTPTELTRYLDYCAEMLALLSKAGALHIQQFNDAETLAAVREIEDLTDGLSRKIWQKITILDRVVNPD